MMIEVIRLLRKDETGFTSVKFLAESLKDMGYPLHKKKFSTYMEYLLDLGLVEQTGIHHYPYRIVASKEKLTCVEDMFLMLGQTGGMPEMVFEFVLKKNNIDPVNDLSIDQSIDFGSPAAAFSGGKADFTVEFEPSATALETEKAGYVVASVGVDSGYVPYTAFSAKESYIKDHPDILQAFTDALQKGMQYVNEHTSEEIAQTIAPQFPDTEEATIAAIVERYQKQDTWKEDVIFSEEAYTLLLDILEESGQLTKRPAYEDLIHTEFAEQAAKEQ